MPTELGKLNLWRMDLSQNLLTNTIPVEIPRNLQKLQIFNLEANLLSGNLMTEFGGLSNMTLFRVNGNSFLQGSLPSELGLLSLLEDLNVSGTLLSGTIPDPICWGPSVAFDCGSLMCGCDCNCSNNYGLNPDLR